jgi:YD repeat-containing protein
LTLVSWRPNDRKKRRLSNRVTSIRQHGVTGGNAVAEKRIDFSYDGLGQYATVTTYANLAGTQLVSTATYAFDNAYQLVGLTYAKGTTTLASYAYTYDAEGNRTQNTSTPTPMACSIPAIPTSRSTPGTTATG